MSHFDDKDSNKFWQDSLELTAKGNWIRFVDGEPEEIVIDSWIIHQVDTNWGRKPALKTRDDKFFKVESKRLRFLLAEYSGKKVRLEVTRFDSEPNPLQTWWTVEKLKLTKQTKISGKELSEI